MQYPTVSVNGVSVRIDEEGTMRTWGRITDQNGNKRWVVVESDVNGDFSYGWLTTLIQTLKLGLGESRFTPITVFLRNSALSSRFTLTIT
ncbi:TPA: hypothetical protein ACY2HE_000873 [Yersinia enterocolitica]